MQFGAGKTPRATFDGDAMNVIEKTIRRIDAMQQSHSVPAFLFAITKKYGDDNAGALTVQLTYSLFVTVFPLLLLLVTILGIVLADDAADRQRVLNSAFGQFPIIGTQLAHNVHAMKRSSVFGLVFGILGLVYGTTGLAQSGLYSMEQIWNLPSATRPNYLTRMIRSVIFLIVLAVGLVLATALAGFGTFGHHNIWLGILGEVLAAIVNVGLYLAAFRVLTPKQVSTRSLLPGVVVGGCAWTVLQAVGGYVVGHDLKGASAVYGLFGFVLGLVAWIYLGAEITLYAAEVNTVWFRRLWPRGMVQPPLTDADQRSLALQVAQNQRRPEQEVSTKFHHRPMTQAEYIERGYKADESAPGLEQRFPEDPHPKPAVDDAREPS
jgi:YihY family inner membrane protein